MQQALLRAGQIRDKYLQAALRLDADSRDGSFLLPVLQLPDDVGAALEPEGQNAQREVMCPRLYRAAFYGSANELHRLVTARDWHDGHHCNREEVSAGRNTVLHIAAAQGHIGLVRRLLEDAPPADQSAEEAALQLALLGRRNSKSETALHVATRAGHHEMVSLLIMLAQKTHGPGAAQLLLSRNSGGDMVLHVAARHGRHAVVERLLVVAPALSSGVNNAGVSPLYLAVMSRSLDIVKALLQCHATASASGPSGQNALHAAVLQSAEITQELVLRKLYLATETDESGSNPLHYATSDGDREIIDKFLSCVASSALYMRDDQGFTPLHIAAWMGHVGVIHDILQACPDCSEVTDTNGRNFLDVAIGHGHESVVKYIVGSPFARELVNEQDNDGNSPLHTAVIAGKPQLAILESEFVELNITNNEGRRPFDVVSDITSFLPMIGFLLKLSAREAWIGTQRQDRVPVWKGKAMKEWIEKLSKNLGIVAVLIATIALNAMANVPGGFDSEGVPNLHGRRHYKTFLTLDTVAVACSMIATMLLIYGRGSSSGAVALIFFWFAVIGMLLAFMVAVIPGLHNSAIVKRFVWSIFVMPFGSMVALSFVWAMPAPTVASVILLFRARTREDSVSMRRHMGRRFLFQLGFYLLVLYLLGFYLLEIM